MSLGRVELKDALWDTELEIGHWCPARCQRRGSRDMPAFSLSLMRQLDNQGCFFKMFAVNITYGNGSISDQWER